MLDRVSDGPGLALVPSRAVSRAGESEFGVPFPGRVVPGERWAMP